MRTICVLDTEFNALDYAGQNGGYQDITEIGAVLMAEGKIVGRFFRVCRLHGEHKLTERCQQITGMDAGRLADGVPFNEAIFKLIDFARQSRVYAYGADDALQLRETAKLNGASKETFGFINSIRNIYPIFAQNLGLPYQCSLLDVCRVCEVPHDMPGRAHSALYDAEDTALAYHNMNRGNIDQAALARLKEHKKNIGIYVKCRNIPGVSINPLPYMDGDFLAKLEDIFENAGSVISEPVLRALRDDFMRMAGRPDLEKGCEDI